MRITLLLILCFFAGKTAMAQYDHLLPESTYPYWPEYNYLNFDDLKNIEEQPWIDENHIIDGWDWSLPDFVEPSTRSLVGLQRNFNTDKEFKPINLKFKSNGVGLLWVAWRDIEKTEGDIDFTPIINRIKQANNDGSEIILRILCHAKSRDGSISKGQAPLWLEDLGATLSPPTNHNHNFDPSNPVFHAHYLRLINELAKTEIPDLVKAAYVGYASHALGDEGIGPYGENNYEANDTVKHVQERLDAWENAFKGMEYKVFMGGPSNYGFEKGFGARRGFVEMYWYHIPDEIMGQEVNDDGYLYVDEHSPLISYECFNGEVNEEYEPAWATEGREYRFGKTTSSFTYRYFISNLRALQMRCTYVHTTGHLIPEMLPFISQELGRTVDDTPDAWSFLVTSYLKYSGETKNFERWLYQRDEPGYETQPVLKIQQPRIMWMIENNKYYDYIARKGEKMGFNIDDRMFPKGEQAMAIKVSFLDSVPGTIRLKYATNDGVKTDSVESTGENKIRTATFFINARMDDTGFDHDFDFILESEEEVPVSFVRVIKTETEYISNNQLPYEGMNRIIPGTIEGEHYDEGGEGFAYHDDSVKQGDLTFRPTDNVDVVSKNGASNNYVVSYTNEGEWLEYTVDATTGMYDITLYYFCGETPGDLIVSLDGEVLDTITGLQNQGWEIRDSIMAQNILIGNGGKKKILRLEFTNGAGFDIDAIKFTKQNIPVSNVTLTGCPGDTLFVGSTWQLSASVTPSYASDLTVTWNSSDESVATVDSCGLVTAKSQGSVTITATTNDGGYTKKCAIGVMSTGIAVTDIAITGCPASALAVDSIYLLSANITPANAGDQRVNWISSNETVAAVDENGWITPLSAGETTITAITNDGGYTDECAINVDMNVNTKKIGGTNQFVEVYPNPASDVLRFRFSDSVSEKKISFYNTLGQLLFNKNTFNNNLKIDISEFNSDNLLIVKVISGGIAATFKVIISNKNRTNLIFQ